VHEEKKKHLEKTPLEKLEPEKKKKNFKLYVKSIWERQKKVIEICCRLFL